MKPIIILVVAALICSGGALYLWGRHDGEKGRSYIVQCGDVKVKLTDLLGKSGIVYTDDQLRELNRLMYREKIGFQQEKRKTGE